MNDGRSATPESRVMSNAASASARVWPFSRLASTTSLRLDGGDEERATGPRELGQQRAVTEQVLDLGREVVGHAGELGVQRAHELPRVAGTVEKVGIAERDVSRAGGDEAANVAEHHVGRHDEEAPVVDGGNRAVEAVVQTAAARLHVSRRDLRPVAPEFDVARERRERIATWDWELETRASCVVRRA